ncbi:MAG: pseudouridylate synthase [Muribaculaceae bacterium]
MEISDIDIHELLPQQEPFVMVGCLMHFDRELAVTRTPVSDTNIFVENGCMTVYGITENIAQTCAASIGYYNKYILKKSIRMGLIGAIRHLEFLRLPHVGEVLETSVVTVDEVFDMTLVTATVKAGNDLIARCEMKIALSDPLPLTGN